MNSMYFNISKKYLHGLRNVHLMLSEKSLRRIFNKFKEKKYITTFTKKSRNGIVCLNIKVHFDNIDL